MVRVGINGFGRIGRCVLRAALRSPQEVQIVAINDLGDLNTMAHLLRHDSVHGNLQQRVDVLSDGLEVDGKKISLFSNPDPKAIPWQDAGIDLIIESTGRFTTKETASAHLRDGIDHVIISAPSKDADVTICMGVNEDAFDVEKHRVISNASCTTNCLAPVAKVLNDEFGIVAGTMTTIHSYTNDQQVLDLPHKDLRRARAAALSMIPTSTGAAKAVGLVLPELKGKFDGISVRVPTPNVSLVDLSFVSEKDADTSSINAALKRAADGPMKGIIAYTEEELVSADFNGDPHSATVDSLFTKSTGNRLHKVLAWYDNEWGYSNRVLDLARLIGRRRSEKGIQ